MLARPRLVAVLAAAGLLAGSAVALAQPTSTTLHLKVLSRDLLSPAWRANPVGGVAPSTPWTLGVTIAGANDALKDQLFKAQNDPKSAAYHRYLTAEQYKQMFAVDTATTAKVRSWITSTGMDVTYTDAEGSYITVGGTAAQAQALTHTTLTTYKASKGGGLFIANAQAPTVPDEVTSIAGLDTLSVAHTSAQPHALFPLSDVSSPQTLWKFYDQPSNIRGTGQKLAAFGWGAPGSVVADLQKFQAEKSLPAMPLNIVQVGVPNTTDTSGLVEWDLDSQAASGMAPDADSMTFYFANAGNSDLLAASIKTWADDPNGAQQASGSYGLCEVFGVLGTFDAHEAALQQAALEGRTFFASTGDNGSGCSAVVNTNGITIGPIPSPEYPATSVYSVGVGGTVIYFDDPSGTRDSTQAEIAWTHGGGGPSYLYSTPSWQVGTPLTATDARLSADVAAQSGDLISGYDIVTAGTDSFASGTSLATPLWQGMWARIASSKPATPLGFGPPLLWNAGASGDGSFFDVTVGSNGLYDALPGYDFPTGWGTPDVTKLMFHITGVTPASYVPPRTTGGGSKPASSPHGHKSDGTGATVTCPAAPQITDPADDATQLAVADSGQSAASQPDLDVLSAGVTGTSTGAVFRITVKDLSQNLGENFRFDFTVGGVAYEITASRDQSGATQFYWTKPGLNASSLGDLAGSFAGNVITVTLPSAAFQAVAGVPLSIGATGTGLSVLGQRYVVVLTGTADSAAPTDAACVWGI